MKWKKHHKSLASCLIMKTKGNKMCYTVNRLNGDYMRYEDLKSLFDRNNELKFRLYNLDYIIRNNYNGVEVFAVLYPNDKKIYSSFDDAMNNYKLFNESLNGFIDKIKI